MKKILFVLLPLLFLTIGIEGCDKDAEKTDDQICDNLNKGNASQISITGKWDFVCYAYTIDGKNIENKDAISKGYVHFTDVDSLYMEYNNLWKGKFVINKANKITMNIVSVSFAMPLQEEQDISDAINNSQCYMEKEDTLLIHYAGKENKNILILKKRQN
jgi:hypothetical protein